MGDGTDAVGVQATKAVAFGVGGGGQDHVGKRHHGRRHKEVFNHHELQGLVPLELFFGLGAHGRQEVVGREVGAAYGVLAVLPLLDGGVRREVFKAHGKHRVALDADALGVFLFGQQLVVAPGARPVGLLDAPACAPDHVAAGHVEVAGDGPHGHQRMRRLLAAGLLVKRHAPLDGGGLGLGVGARHTNDVFLGDPALLGQLVEVVFLHALTHCLEAVDPLVAEVLVVETLVADNLEHGHRQGAVAAGTHAQPVLAGARGNPGEVGVDHGDLHPALHQVQDPVAVKTVGVGVEGLVAPDDAVLGHLVAWVVVALGEELRAVHDAGIADHARHRGDARQVARVAREIGDALVGRAHAGVDARDLMDVAAGALAAGDGVAAVGVGYALELAHDDVVGLVPGTLDELVLAAVGALALHRVQQAVLVVDVIGYAQAAAAQATLVVGVHGVAFDLHELAVFHVRQDAADVVATRRRACRTADDGHAVFFPGPRHLGCLGAGYGLVSQLGFLGQARPALVLSRNVRCLRHLFLLLAIVSLSSRRNPRQVRRKRFARASKLARMSGWPRIGNRLEENLGARRRGAPPASDETAQISIPAGRDEAVSYQWD